jgi:MFS family permease
MASPTAQTTIRSATSGRLALAALATAMLLSSLGTSVANVALPALEENFDVGFGAVQWVVLAYLLAVTALVVSVGRLGDLVGRRRLLLAGIATFTVASALCAVAPALWLLVLARALQGIGAAAMLALALASVAGAVPATRTGSAMGLLASTSAIGTAAGPSLGGVLLAGLGWRAIFLVNVPLGLVALGLAARGLPVDRPRSGAARPRHDLLGTVLLALALGAYALAMTAGAGPFTPAGIALLLAALAGAGLLAVAGRRAENPLIDPATLRDPLLRAGLLTSAAVSTVVMATLVVGPFHLARGLGLGPAAVGVVMSAGPAVVALSGVPAGRVADRLGTGRVTLAGLAGMAAGAIMLALAPVRLGVPGYVGPIAVLALGYAMFQTGNTAAVMAAAPADRRGVTSGMLNLSRNLGLITGASLMGAVFAMASGAGVRAEDVATGMRTTFLLAAALLLAAIVAAAGGVRRRRSARIGLSAR